MKSSRKRNNPCWTKFDYRLLLIFYYNGIVIVDKIKNREIRDEQIKGVVLSVILLVGEYWLITDILRISVRISRTRTMAFGNRKAKPGLGNAKMVVASRTAKIISKSAPVSSSFENTFDTSIFLQYEL